MKKKEEKTQTFKEEQEVFRLRGKLYLSPKKGYAWNPLTKLPRNMPCPCQSGRKFKACHLSKLAQIVPENQAREYEAAMKEIETIRFMEEPQTKEDKVQ